MILAEASVFFDINLPDPTTWFYFSGLLAGALFVSLVAVAVRQPAAPPPPEDRSGALSDKVPNLAGKGIKSAETVIQPDTPLDDSSVRLWAERSLALVGHLSIVVALVLI